jgi:uncharacterized protein (TIGR03382 family)
MIVVALVVCGLACTPAGPVAVGVQQRAVGEPQNGFPNWDERAIHLWINRGRAEPQTDLQAECNVAAIADIDCYHDPQTPLLWSYQLNRAARFHSANQTSCGSMTHNSPCALVSTIGDEASGYTPGPCDGDKSCACQGGTCSGSTGWSSRVSLFGGSANGECVASGGLGDPLGEYYMWVCEGFSMTPPVACQYYQGTYGNTNGHRWNILMGGGPAVGTGCAGNYCTLDFGGPAAASNKIVVGVHYPEGGSTVAFRAHWYDTAAPAQAMVNINGSCQAMVKERGVNDNNATYLLDNAAIGSGCTHYYFVFKDSGGNFVTWPESGSYGINCGADYDSATRPSMDASCSCTPDCAGKACGPDGCGGNCPPGCGANATCSANACTCTVLACGAACCATGQVCHQDACCTKNCGGKTCGTDGCGGSCGTCQGSLACQADGTCGCSGGLTACGTACVNTQSDVNNCGSCNHPCTAPQVCAAGTCSDTCQTGYENCSGSCADLQTDATHCGDCATACSPGATCAAGECVCPGGLRDCPGAGCTDVLTDPANCGACGRECEGCADGRCPGDGEDGGTSDNGLTGSCGCAARAGGGTLLAVLLLALAALARRRR